MKSPIDVAIYLYGEDLDPLVISQVLGVSPTRAWRRGERIVGEKSGGEFNPRIGLWMYKTISQSKQLSDHVNEILACLKLNTVGEIERVNGVQQAKIDVYMLPDAGEDATLSLDARDLQALGRLGLRLEITAGCMADLDQFGSQV